MVLFPIFTRRKQRAQYKQHAQQHVQSVQQAQRQYNDGVLLAFCGGPIDDPNFSPELGNANGRKGYNDGQELFIESYPSRPIVGVDVSSEMDPKCQQWKNSVLSLVKNRAYISTLDPNSRRNIVENLFRVAESPTYTAETTLADYSSDQMNPVPLSAYSYDFFGTSVNGYHNISCFPHHVPQFPFSSHPVQYSDYNFGACYI